MIGIIIWVVFNWYSFVSYRRLGLLTSLNRTAGGREQANPDTNPAAEEAMDEDQEPRELQDDDIEELKKTLKPGEGLIQRDDEGNVIRVIVGEAKSHNDILDAEPAPVEAKTDVVRGIYEDRYERETSETNRRFRFSFLSTRGTSQKWCQECQVSIWIPAELD